jgi:hypothetical protein
MITVATEAIGIEKEAIDIKKEAIGIGEEVETDRFLAYISYGWLAYFFLEACTTCWKAWICI